MILYVHYCVSFAFYGRVLIFHYVHKCAPIRCSTVCFLGIRYASGFETGYADGFPLLLASEESLADLNARIEQNTPTNAGAANAKFPALPMNRCLWIFLRSSIYLSVSSKLLSASQCMNSKHYFHGTSTVLFAFSSVNHSFGSIVVGSLLGLTCAMH